jgi:hypothetical protein
VAQNLKYRGLCETCDYDAACTFRRSALLAVIQCEEFETTRPVPVGPVNLKQEPFHGTVRSLCSNCAHVLTCALPAARNGIVNCEEYALQ